MVCARLFKPQDCNELEAIIIEGFRGYGQRCRIPISQLTAFVGQNDIGKSTILEALDAFFNDIVDAQDLNTASQSKKFTIGCTFSSLPYTINLDATSQTTLAGEYLINQDGKLEIHKRAPGFFEIWRAAFPDGPAQCCAA
jgi:putative ATP-dependent endonuclease of OLD family